MGRSPSCDDQSGLKKGPWTPEEDQKLVQYIQNHGHGSWRALPKPAGLNRCGKSCRLRWSNYLRPDIKRGKFSEEEEQTILNLHSIMGNKWSAIASHLPGRTDNEIKNFWNTHLKKKLIQMGFDPMTHQPRTDIFTSLTHLLALANLKDLIMDHHHHQQQPLEEQALRLQAEAFQMAKLQYLQYLLQPQAASSSTQNTNMININREFITDTENSTINLLNSLSSVQPKQITTSFDLEPSICNDLQGMINNDVVDGNSIQFGHLPALLPVQASSSSDQFTALSNGDQRDSPSSPIWLVSSSSSPSPPASMAAPPPPHFFTQTCSKIDMENNNACGSWSYGGRWPDLVLEESFFQ